MNNRYNTQCICCSDDIFEGQDCYMSDYGVLCTYDCALELIYDIINENILEYRNKIREKYPHLDKKDYPISQWSYQEIADQIEQEQELLAYFDITSGELENPFDFDEDMFRDR